MKILNSKWRCIEVVATSCTRNAVVLLGTRVRIPPSPSSASSGKPLLVFVLFYPDVSVCKVFRYKRNKVKRYCEQFLLRIITVIVLRNLNGILKLIMV